MRRRHHGLVNGLQQHLETIVRGVRGRLEQSRFPLLLGNIICHKNIESFKALEGGKLQRALLLESVAAHRSLTLLAAAVFFRILLLLLSILFSALLALTLCRCF